MNTIELSAALGQAQVVENLKNFVGVDAQGAAALMTPERLAAVAGGKMSLYSGKLNLKDLVLNEVGIKAVCEEVIKHLPDDTMFSLIVSCGNTIMVNGYIVDKKRYGFITAYSYNSHKGSFPILDGLLKERV